MNLWLFVRCPGCRVVFALKAGETWQRCPICGPLGPDAEEVEEVIS